MSRLGAAGTGVHRGPALVADGMGFHIPKGYLYFAIAFSVGVEALNILATRRRRAAKAGT